MPASFTAGADRRALAGFGVIAAVVLLWFVGNGYLREPLDGARAAYDGGVPLELPGSHDIHLGEEEAQLYGDVTALIDRHCPAMVMLPGMDSFYLWSGQEPPSYTATGWETLFDEAHQQRVIDDTRGIAGLCLLRNPARAAGWGEKPGTARHLPRTRLRPDRQDRRIRTAAAPRGRPP